MTYLQDDLRVSMSNLICFQFFTDLVRNPTKVPVQDFIFKNLPANNSDFFFVRLNHYPPPKYFSIFIINSLLIVILAYSNAYPISYIMRFTFFGFHVKFLFTPFPTCKRTAK